MQINSQAYVEALREQRNDAADLAAQWRAAYETVVAELAALKAERGEDGAPSDVA